MESAFTRAVSAVLTRELSGYISLSSCEKLTAGASQETYRLACVTADGETLLALRRTVPTMQAHSSVAEVSPATEAKLLTIAKQAGIPVPQVNYVLRASDDLGEGFVMQWLEGETLGQRITHSDSFAQLRPTLAFACGAQLARVHAIDWQAAGLEGLLPRVSPRALIDETWVHYRDLGIPLPMIDYTWRWLQQNLPVSSRTTLVHGDFRNGNLMVTPQGINAVLDWELAHIGDPVRDIGYLCVNSWRFGKRELSVGGFGEIEDLLAGYQSVSGITVARDEVRYWQVFGSFWWAMTTLRMAHSWRTGENPSLERPVIGRRSSEAQMDCVNLLLPGEFSLPPINDDLADGCQLPMPAELLESVRGFLQEEVAGGNNHTGFMARVAANSLGIAQREMLYGPALAEAEAERLRLLLGANKDLGTLRRQLVTALRNDMALDSPGLQEHLRQVVAGQLFIDQPRYSALRQYKPA